MGAGVKISDSTASNEIANARVGVAYVLARQNYFSQGSCGRVSHALGVARGLAKAGVPVTIVSGEGLGGYNPHFLDSVKLVEVGPRKFRRTWLSLLLDEVDRVLRSDPSIRYVVVRYAISNSFRFSGLIRRYPDRVWVFEVNSLLYHQYPQLPLAVRRIALRLERRILRRADLSYVVSDTLRTDLIAEGGVPQERVLVIPNAGPDEWGERVLPMGEHPEGGERSMRFLYLGIFHKYYQFEVVLEAFDEIRREGADAELHLYGDGPLVSEVRHRARGRRDIFLHGRYDLSALMQAGQIGRGTALVLPYRDIPIARVGSPIKLYEYMALGRPILSSSVGQLGKVLTHLRTAYLYKAGDARSCANGMRWIMADAERREALGSAARAEFLERHTWTARMRYFFSLLELYRSDRQSRPNNLLKPIAL